jgi:glycosyltransferase involved in cell wall biosynthesis
MKNKIKRVALYNPYLDTLGGGEKHILSILEVFAEQGYEVSIFWDKNLTKEIKDRFAFQYIDTLKWVDKKNLKNLWSYDYFFYVTDGSYFFSSAKNNFIFCMVPDKKLYNLNLINKLKLHNYRFISNSIFTTKWLNKWSIDPITIPPYISDTLLNQKIDFKNKEKTILSVGRFFSHLHSKNQEEIIRTFQKLKKKSGEFSGCKLILVGGLKNEDQKYFDGLKKLAENDSSIILKPNINLDELYKFYKLSNYFWHFAGLGVDENKNPELVEHFGIAPLEAMSSGCLTFCYSAGGPKELIKDGKNGFLFSNVDELIDKMINVDSDESLKKEIRNNAINFVKNEFSYEIFKNKVLKLI